MGTNSATYTAPNYVAVTTSDVVGGNIPQFRALYVGVGGDVAVVPTAASTSSVIFKNVASGQVLLVQGVRVNNTGTSATDIVALY